MKKFYLFFLMLMPLLSNAQIKGQAMIDSLLQELSNSKEDSHQVKLLDLISYNYSTINPAEGLKYGYKAKELAEKLEWKKGIASAHSDIGINYAAKSDHQKAIDHYEKASALYAELNNKNGVSAMMANTSLVYMAQSNYPKALEFAFKALDFKEDINKKTEAIILENIGTIYLRQKNYSKTMEYYGKALSAYEKLGSKKGVARNLGNTGIVLDAQGNFNKALEYHLRALKTNQELGDENSVQINQANVGYVYNHLKNYPKALNYQLQALKTSEKSGLKASIAVNMGNIGETYFAIATDTGRAIEQHPLIGKSKDANLQQSVKYLEKAVALCKEINYAGPQIEFSQYLSDAYFLLGDYKNALYMFKEYSNMKDTVFSHQSKVELAKLETKRELDLKDKDIIIGKLNAANKRNERILYISGIILLLIVIGVTIRKFIDRNRMHKNVMADIAQIQAHEIRGPLATLQGLVQLFNVKESGDPLNKELIGYITAVTTELDAKVKNVVDKTIINN